MSLVPHFDAASHFIHSCDKCGKPAVFGSGVSLRNGKLGKWRCGSCKLGAIARDPSNNKTEALLRAALQENVPREILCVVIAASGAHLIFGRQNSEKTNGQSN